MTYASIRQSLDRMFFEMPEVQPVPNDQRAFANVTDHDIAQLDGLLEKRRRSFSERANHIREESVLLNGDLNAWRDYLASNPREPGQGEYDLRQAANQLSDIARILNAMADQVAADRTYVPAGPKEVAIKYGEYDVP